MHDGMQIFLMFMAGAFLVFMGILSGLLLWKMAKNEINLATILNESNGDASISRFQLLLFSMVVAVGLFLVMINKLALPDIPNSILVLLGISASTYAAGKGISFSRVEGILKPGQIPPDGPPPDSPAVVPIDPAAASPAPTDSNGQ
jgi:archaellum biogenesis protein FlaJ (TadC family)